MDAAARGVLRRAHGDGGGAGREAREPGRQDQREARPNQSMASTASVLELLFYSFSSTAFLPQLLFYSFSPVASLLQLLF